MILNLILILYDNDKMSKMLTWTLQEWKDYMVGKKKNAENRQDSKWSLFVMSFHILPIPVFYSLPLVFFPGSIIRGERRTFQSSFGVSRGRFMILSSFLFPGRFWGCFICYACFQFWFSSLFWFLASLALFPKPLNSIIK